MELESEVVGQWAAEGTKVALPQLLPTPVLETTALSNR